MEYVAFACLVFLVISGVKRLIGMNQTGRKYKYATIQELDEQIRIKTEQLTKLKTDYKEERRTINPSNGRSSEQLNSQLNWMLQMNIINFKEYDEIKVKSLPYLRG